VIVAGKEDLRAQSRLERWFWGDGGGDCIGNIYYRSGQGEIAWGFGGHHNIMIEKHGGDVGGDYIGDIRCGSARG